jgi:superfamily I DNA and/or RNA helicase
MDEFTCPTCGSPSVWSDREVVRTIGLDDILVIAPYNAQVFELQERIPGGRIGTVDKFHGQEAPIVIYSITSSDQGSHGVNRLRARSL